jgi:hypothetical protein
MGGSFVVQFAMYYLTILWFDGFGYIHLSCHSFVYFWGVKGKLGICNGFALFCSYDHGWSWLDITKFVITGNWKI